MDSFSKYLEWIGMAVLFFGLIYISKESGFIDRLKPETKSAKIFMFMGILVIMHIVLMIHELGHLITGLVQGFRFELFVVGFLGVKREGERIKFYFNKDFNYYGGVAATSPVDDSSKNAGKFARILLAGPIASILFAIVCIMLAYLFPRPLGIIYYTGGIISIAIFLATTIPTKTGMFFTDRKRYQRLVTPGHDQDVELAMLSIMGKFSKDGSYHNVKRDEIDVLLTDETPFIRYSGLFSMMCWQLEHLGHIEDNIQTQYNEASEGFSKNITTLFNQEIQKYREKHSSTSHS